MVTHLLTSEFEIIFKFQQSRFKLNCQIYGRHPLIISMHASPHFSHHRLIQQRLVIYSAIILQLATCLAIMSEASSTSGKHWSDEEVNEMLDRLSEWRRDGNYGDGGNFPSTAFTAVSQHLRGKGFQRTRQQCQSKYSGVRT